MQVQKIEIKLGTSLELVEPKDKDLLIKVDNSREINIDVLDPDPVTGYIFINILKIINYGDHILVREIYRSPLGEITIDKHYENAKPSEVLKMYFPHTFK